MGREKQRRNPTFDNAIQGQVSPDLYTIQAKDSAAAYGFGTSRRSDVIYRSIAENPGPQNYLPPIRGGVG